MLGHKVAVFNIRDVEGFTRANLPRVILTSDAREELVCEGLRILMDMARAYQPGRNGQNPLTSSFSAYAKAYLPGKLRDAWHRQEGHTLTTLPDGSREWHYPLKGTSLDGLVDREGGSDVMRLHDGSKMQVEDVYDEDAVQQIRFALGELSKIENEQALKVLVLKAEGFEAGVVAVQLRMPVEEVNASIDRLSQCARYLRAEEAAA